MKNKILNNLFIVRLAYGAALTACAGLTACAAPDDQELAAEGELEEVELAEEEDEELSESELALVQAGGPTVVGVTRSDVSRTSGGGKVTRTVQGPRVSNGGRTVRLGGGSSGGRTVRIGNGNSGGRTVRGGGSSGRTVRSGGSSSGGRTVRIGGARSR